MTLPVLPAENDDPWYEKRNAFDLAVKADLEGRLSDAELSATIGGVVFDTSSFPGATAEDRLHAAMAAHVGVGEVRLRVTEPLELTETLTIDVGWVGLDFQCGEVDASALTGETAVHVTNTRTGGAVANNRRSITGLTLVGPGKADAGSIGLLFSSASSESSVRGLAIYDHEVRSFAVGHQFESNACLLSFFNTHIYQCGTAIYMPAGGTNYGENLRYFGAGVGSSDLGIRNENANGNFHMISPSIDFCGVAINASLGGVELVDPHIELNSDGVPITGVPFQTGVGQRGRLLIVGGTIVFHNTPASDAITHTFTTGNTGWGGGIRVVGTQMYNTSGTSGYLCGGTGQITFDNMFRTDGGGTVRAPVGATSSLPRRRT
jgi:hypothetical protein